MSVRVIKTDATTDLFRLAEEVAAEYSQGERAARRDLGILVEQLPNSRQYVTVVWDAFRPVPAADRGKVILEAIRIARGEDEMLRTSVALGLTHAEAERLGVRTN